MTEIELLIAIRDNVRVVVGVLLGISGLLFVVSALLIYIREVLVAILEALRGGDLRD